MSHLALLPRRIAVGLIVCAFALAATALQPRGVGAQEPTEVAVGVVEENDVASHTVVAAGVTGPNNITAPNSLVGAVFGLDDGERVP